MRISGKSLEGQVAFAHFSLLVIAFVVFIAYFPARPSEATQQQIIISDTAWTLMSILIFPLGYIGYLFPNTSEFYELQLIWIILAPLNSYLWGYVIVRIQRRMNQWIREIREHAHSR